MIIGHTSDCRCYRCHECKCNKCKDAERHNRKQQALKAKYLDKYCSQFVELENQAKHVDKLIFINGHDVSMIERSCNISQELTFKYMIEKQDPFPTNLKLELIKTFDKHFIVVKW